MNKYSIDHTQPCRLLLYDMHPTRDSKACSTLGNEWIMTTYSFHSAFCQVPPRGLFRVAVQLYYFNFDLLGLLSVLPYIVMFCRVCGFRVRVWESYRASRSFEYGYGSVTKLTERPGIVAQAYRTHRSSRRAQKCCTLTPGIVARGVQNSRKFQVRV